MMKKISRVKIKSGRWLTNLLSREKLTHHKKINVIYCLLLTDESSEI